MKTVVNQAKLAMREELSQLLIASTKKATKLIVILLKACNHQISLNFKYFKSIRLFFYYIIIMINRK